MMRTHHCSPLQSQFDITQAQAEAVIQPNSVLNDLGREAKATARIGRQGHAEKAAMALLPDDVA